MKLLNLKYFATVRTAVSNSNVMPEPLTLFSSLFGRTPVRNESYSAFDQTVSFIAKKMLPLSFIGRNGLAVQTSEYSL